VQPLTSRTERRPPSLLRYAPAFVILAIAIADAARVADTDLWGHIVFGRLFLHAGPVSHDPFNYSVPGHAWAIHEWLAELLMARTYDLFGIFGLKLWKFACTSLTIVLLAMAEAETGAEPPLQAGILLVSAAALMPMMQFRPQLYTYIFLAALMALLARENFRRRAPLWLAVPILALWVNLHGGFVIGVAVLAIYTGVVIVEEIVARDGFQRSVRLSIVTVAGAAATLANPYGWQAWVHVVGALNDPVTRKEMVDWQPLMQVVLANLHSLHSGVIFFSLVVVIMVGLALVFVITPRGGDLALIAVAAAMSAAAFNVLRNMPLAVIAAAAPLARHLHLLGEKIRRFANPSPSPTATSTAPTPATITAAAPVAPATAVSRATTHFNYAGQALFIAAALILTFGRGGLLSPQIPAAMDFPAGAIAFMQTHRLRGNVLARFEWGQYVLFHMASSSRVFVDGRVDLVYPTRVIHQYIDFFGGAPGGARILDSYPNDYVLMPAGSPADRTVSVRPDWKLIYRDPVAALFARTNSPAAHLPGVPVKGTAPPSAFP
jgi:hypothetical protein